MDLAGDIDKRIIDYIIEQAERNDIKNLQIEQDIMDRLTHLYDTMADQIMRTVDAHGDMSNTLSYQSLINQTQRIIEQFYSQAYRLLTPVIVDYAEKGHRDFGDLMNIGLELNEKARAIRVTELAGKKNQMPDPNAVEFMRKHAFEQVRNVSNDLLTKMKAELGAMLVAGKTDKASVRQKVQDILKVNRSRADMIAQTELSMAYNQGALQRMDEFNAQGGGRMLKYWHGFKFSATTCPYCRPRIGNTYDINDNTEVLPAHPRCRCVWLPFMDGWDSPISSMFTSRANMLRRVYQPDEIYDRLNKRLGISYADHLDPNDAVRYLSGDRSSDFYAKLAQARDNAIKDNMASFDIASAKAEERMASEFNIQIQFWKKYVSGAIADVDTQELEKAYTAIKGIMLLPWTGRQLDAFNKILLRVEGHL